MHRQYGDRHRDRRSTEYADVADIDGQARRGHGKRHRVRHKPYDKFSWNNGNDWRAWLEEYDPDTG